MKTETPTDGARGTQMNATIESIKVEIKKGWCPVETNLEWSSRPDAVLMVTYQQLGGVENVIPYQGERANLLEAKNWVVQFGKRLFDESF